jgi:NAD(P)H-nitrite reductase large subunit
LYQKAVVHISDGKDKVESLAFEDGTTLETDMVVMSVGIVQYRTD